MTRMPWNHLQSIAAATCSLIIVLCIPTSLTVQACEIPVYQYALENWDTDAYEVTVFHEGPLSATDREVVGLLREGADHRDGHGNLTVRTVDLEGNPDAIMLHRWRERGGDELPWMVASYPPAKRLSRPAWAGPLTRANARSLLDSPLRRTIASELTRRVTAVWVLLESGNRGKDNAAAALLERELQRLEETLVLPALEAWGGDGGEIEAPPVRFTMHRLSRDSAREQMLIEMLMHSEGDLSTEFAREPMVFPIYGRGLILYALVGAGINEWTIMKAAEFVTGPCSCEVKADNPGTDLLIALDWNALVRQTVQERMPPPTGMAGFQDRAAEAERLLAEVDEAHATEAVSSTGPAEPSARGPRSAAVRSTPPRTLATGEGERSHPKQEASAASPDTPAPPTEAPATSPQAPDTPPPADPEEADVSAESDASAGREQTFTPGDERPRTDDDSGDQTAVARQGDGDDGGVAGVVGVLALIAGGITAALAGTVFFRRRMAARDDEHERIAT